MPFHVKYSVTRQLFRECRYIYRGMRVRVRSCVYFSRCLDRRVLRAKSRKVKRRLAAVQARISPASRRRGGSELVARSVTSHCTRRIVSSSMVRGAKSGLYLPTPNVATLPRRDRERVRARAWRKKRLPRTIIIGLG